MSTFFSNAPTFNTVAKSKIVTRQIVVGSIPVRRPIEDLIRKQVADLVREIDGVQLDKILGDVIEKNDLFDTVIAEGGTFNLGSTYEAVRKKRSGNNGFKAKKERTIKEGIDIASKALSKNIESFTKDEQMEYLKLTRRPDRRPVEKENKEVKPQVAKPIGEKFKKLKVLVDVMEDLFNQCSRMEPKMVLTWGHVYRCNYMAQKFAKEKANYFNTPLNKLNTKVVNSQCIYALLGKNEGLVWFTKCAGPLILGKKKIEEIGKSQKTKEIIPRFDGEKEDLNGENGLSVVRPIRWSAIRFSFTSDKEEAEESKTYEGFISMFPEVNEDSIPVAMSMCFKWALGIIRNKCQFVNNALFRNSKKGGSDAKETKDQKEKGSKGEAEKAEKPQEEKKKETPPETKSTAKNKPKMEE